MNGNIVGSGAFVRVPERGRLSREKQLRTAPLTLGEDKGRHAMLLHVLDRPSKSASCTFTIRSIYEDCIAEPHAACTRQGVSESCVELQCQSSALCAQKGYPFELSLSSYRTSFREHATEIEYVDHAAGEGLFR